MSNVESKTVTYNAGDTTLRGHLETPGDPNGAGILVFPEWWGLNDYIRGRAKMLAELGYTALAADMYGDGKVAANAEEANALMSGVSGDIASGEARIKAALELLQNQPGVDADKIGAIGYCFGGAMVLHAARIGLPIAGVVSFHGALGSFHKPAPGSVQTKILVCHGADDALVPDEDVANFKAEMDAAKADYEFKSYAGALHGYSNPEATAKGKEYGLPLAYSAEVDKQTWADMRSFFERTL